MVKLKPFFSYFGGKYRSAPKYPFPTHDIITEPFAGSAGYSVRYYDRKVILVEANPSIAGIWQYLISVSEAEVLALPLLSPGDSVDDFTMPQEAKWLIGMWVNPGSAQPKKTMVNWKGSTKTHMQSCRWSETIRARIAFQIQFIRHWKIIQGSYEELSNDYSTWFIDPPYFGLGKYYPKNCRSINYETLSDWCRSRNGQVIVCENTGADWLPFEHMADVKGKHTISKEAIWTNENTNA